MGYEYRIEIFYILHVLRFFNVFAVPNESWPLNCYGTLDFVKKVYYYATVVFVLFRRCFALKLVNGFDFTYMHFSIVPKLLIGIAIQQSV